MHQRRAAKKARREERTHLKNCQSRSVLPVHRFSHRHSPSPQSLLLCSGFAVRGRVAGRKKEANPAERAGEGKKSVDEGAVLSRLTLPEWRNVELIVCVVQRNLRLVEAELRERVEKSCFEGRVCSFRTETEPLERFRKGVTMP